jgi:hypothetical protein
MLIPKPTNPEELYKFFAYGMPLDYIDTQSKHSFNYMRKRGWNVLITPDTNNIWLEISYYANWYQLETWHLDAYKYESFKQN